MAKLQRTAAQQQASGRPAPAQATRRRRESADATLHRMAQTRALQPALTIGAVSDPFEQEAERTADAVMATSDRHAAVAGGTTGIGASLMRVVRRALGKSEPVTRKDDDDKSKQLQKSPAAAGAHDEAAMAPALESKIQRMTSGGEPLSRESRAFFEPRFGSDFSAVRVHTGGEAAAAATQINARAFTVGSHIFFAGGEYSPQSQPGKHLIAHELTHTIQQQPAGNATSPKAAPKRVQRGWFGDIVGGALDTIRGWAQELPPYELMTVLLGRDPITDKPVERNGRNIIHAALKLVPSGMAIFDDLEKSGSIERTAKWFDGEIARLDLTWAGIKALFQGAWDALGAGDLLSPSAAWEKIKAIFGPTLARVANFAAAVGTKIYEFIKTAVLGKLAAWASQQRGYKLLTFILGKDAVTGDPVPRTAKGFVQAVLELVPGGDAIFANLEKSKTIERTVAWLEQQIKLLDLSWEKIKDLFSRAWNAFSAVDFLHPIELIGKIAGIFEPPVIRVITFAAAVGKKVLEFIFEGAMMLAGPIGQQIAGIVRKAGAAFNQIVADPVAFIGNLVHAVKLGFQQFGKNIEEHLKTGLINWLVGTLSGAGLELPKVWDLRGILSLVLQILGITYAKMRLKLVKLIGEEKVALLEKGFKFLMVLVTEGPAAAWQMIVESIGSLWDMVIGGIKDWAIGKIVTAAITKLATMLNPAGAVIQAIIAVYNTIAFFVERIKQIADLVEAIVDSIANIAAGKLTQAANYVEKTMGRTIPVILGFLARFIGLGDVSEAIKNVITTIQEKVDLAIDKAIDWIVEKGKAFFGGKQEDPAPGAAAPVTEMPHKEFGEGPNRHEITVRSEGSKRVPMVASTPTPIDDFLANVQKDTKFNADRKAKYLGPSLAAEAKLRTLVNSADATYPEKQALIAAAEVELADQLRFLLKGVAPDELDKYKLEGLVATYGSTPSQKSDRLTPDHQPQAALLKYAAQAKFQGVEIFANTKLKTAVTGSHADNAVTINLHEIRHKLGLTYGQSVSSGVKAAIDNVAGNLSTDLPTKRTNIIGILETEKRNDAKQIQSIARVRTSYSDILALGLDQDPADKLIGAVTNQVIAGEDKILNRSLDDYKSPA